jgi:hypothetical protein
MQARGVGQHHRAVEPAVAHQEVRAQADEDAFSTC